MSTNRIGVNTRDSVAVGQLQMEPSPHRSLNMVNACSLSRLCFEYEPTRRHWSVRSGPPELKSQ